MLTARATHPGAQKKRARGLESGGPARVLRHYRERVGGRGNFRYAAVPEPIHRADDSFHRAVRWQCERRKKPQHKCYR